jgi:site-specific DNA-methyltransferase (adenine-specific)
MTLMRVDLRHGDCVDLMRAMPECSVDSIVTDPPYELSFMGKTWDGAGIAYSLDMWREALRVLKPGGHLFAFGGTRTYHRMACAIEDAGFEIRDSIHWLYGSGFPKSLNVGKQDGCEAWEGWGTALKPAHEPVVVARKPLSGTVAGNVLVWGTGGLNIDGCRVGTDENTGRPPGRVPTEGWGLAKRTETSEAHASGRWPANIVLDGAAAAALDQQSGVSKSQSGVQKFQRPEGHAWSESKGMWTAGREWQAEGYGDRGGASRFFTQADFGPDDWPFVYQAKPSKRERNAGLDGLPKVKAGSMSGGEETRPGRPTNHPERQNHHPTVKPVALMRHLVRLVTPPGGTVLDPFAGSGTTLVAAVLEGMNAIGCEMTDEYLPIIEGRVAWAEGQARAAAEAEANPEQPTLL